MVDTFEDMVVSRVVSYNEHTIAQVLTGPKAARLGNSKSFQLCMDLQRLLDEGVHADVSFVAGSTVVPAHKAILSARCQHFKYAFHPPSLAFLLPAFGLS